MRKVNFGCGSNLLPGWENHDLDCDIRNSLPFQTGAIDFILAEHCMEHITPKQAWCFLAECWRILKVQGVARIAVPDVTAIWTTASKEYAKAVQDGGHGDGSTKSCVRAAIFCHGHESVWNASLLFTIMSAVGFKCAYRMYGFSPFPELNDIDGHHKVVGRGNAQTETAVVEGTK